MKTETTFAIAGVFCRSGIESLSLLGCDAFSFGCETETDALFELKRRCDTVLSSEEFSANLQNEVGSGYEFGWFDEDREFVSVGWTEEEKISMTAAGI